MRWFSVQTYRWAAVRAHDSALYPNFISNRGNPGLEVRTEPVFAGWLWLTCLFEHHYKLCKIIQQWPVICITDSNTSYMQLSLLCFMDLLVVSGGIRSEFISSCVSELKLRVCISTHVCNARYPLGTVR
jgi:hypothetical protein